MTDHDKYQEIEKKFDNNPVKKPKIHKVSGKSVFIVQKNIKKSSKKDEL